MQCISIFSPGPSVLGPIIVGVVHLVEANSSGVTGRLILVQFAASSEVKIWGYISNLSAGAHGFHVHETGATGNNCADAGGHFNPSSVSTEQSRCLIVMNMNG